jgi:hypothetical protein
MPGEAVGVVARGTGVDDQDVDVAEGGRAPFRPRAEQDDSPYRKHGLKRRHPFSQLGNDLLAVTRWEGDFD